MKSVGKIHLWKAREMIAEAEKRLGLENRLDAEQRAGTAELLAKYGSDLPETTARILSNYIVNIAVFGGGDEDAIARLANDIADAFLGAVKTPNARKAVSALLNQKFFADVDSLLYKMPSSMVDIGRDEEEAVYEIKGGDMFVSRTQVEDDEPDPIVGENGTNIGCKLDISKDGKTAYLAMRVEKDLMATTVDVENPRKIGKVSVFLMSTGDLTKDIPEVTTVTFAQRFTEKIDPTA